MNTIINQLTEFLNDISENMVLYVSDDNFSIEPIDSTDYPRDEADDAIEVNNHTIYIFEDL